MIAATGAFTRRHRLGARTGLVGRGTTGRYQRAGGAGQRQYHHFHFYLWLFVDGFSVANNIHNYYRKITNLSFVMSCKKSAASRSLFPMDEHEPSA
jgi:hypothetical protein